MKYFTPGVRRWSYGVTGAGLVVLGVYGYLDGQQIAAWAALGAAVFGMAIANTPKSTTPEARGGDVTNVHGSVVNASEAAVVHEVDVPRRAVEED